MEQGPVGRILALEEEVAPAVAAALDAEPARAGLARIEQGGVLAEDGVGRLAQGRDVVEDPEAPAVGRGDEVVVARVDEEVVDGDRGHVQRQAGPARAAVAAEEDPEFRAQEEEVLVDRVLADDVDGLAVGDAGGDGRPGLAEVGRLEDVGLEVVAAVAVERHVAGALVEARGLDPAAPETRRDALDVRPGRWSRSTPPFRVSWTLPSSVPTQIRPGTRGDSEIVMIVQWVSAPVTSGVMPPVGLAWPPILRGVLRLVVRRQVGADDHPVVAAVDGLEEVVVRPSRPSRDCAARGRSACSS